MHNRISKYQTCDTKALIDELINRFDEVVFIGRNDKFKGIIACSHGDPYVNIGMMEGLKIKINDSVK